MSKNSCRDGKWLRHSIFKVVALDETGVLNLFETSQDKVTPPTFEFNTYNSQPTMKTGLIHRIHYRLNPTNAVTFTLRLWQASVANPYELNMEMLYESPPLQADDTDYDRAELVIPFSLTAPGRFYYSIEWTAAPGNTVGFIEVSGEKHE